MESGLVSVMMPAYNAEAFIKEALDSLVRQEYPDWEAIVINDGSTDRTSEVLKQYSDPRIRVYDQENKGEAEARNSALARLRGEFVAFLDADDLLLPQHLILTVEYLTNHPEVGGVYTDGYHIDAEGRRLDQISSHRRGPFEGNVFEQLVRASDVFGPPMCTVLRRDRILLRQLTFDPRIVIGPDWDFLTRFAESEDVGYLAERTCLYRVHSANITHTATIGQRTASLALCREKAIKLGRFACCSSEVRTYAFYDLLVDLLAGHPERQAEITEWPQFQQLPKASQSRLLRLMAGRALAVDLPSPWAGIWLRRSVELRPSDARSRLLLALYTVSPSLCRMALRVRGMASGGRSSARAREAVA